MLRSPMRFAAIPLLAFALAAAAFVTDACTLTPLPTPPPPSVACSTSTIAQGMTTFSPSDVAVSIETNGDPGLEIVRADLARYLGQLWGSPVTVSAQAPDLSKRATVWLSTSDAVGADAGLAASATYAMRRTDGPSGTVVRVAAHDATGLAYGAYAFLE